MVSRAGHLGRVPQASGRIPPLLPLVVSSGQEYIVLPLHPSAISPYAATTESNGAHTHARSLPPGPPWPARVCSRPIRDGCGGFAATLAHCAQLASGRHVMSAPVLRAGAGFARPTRRPARRFVSFSLLRVPVPPAAAPGPRRPRPPTGPAALPSSRPAARQGVRRSRGRCQQRCRRAHSRTVARPLLWPAPSRPHAPRPPSAVQPSPPQRPSPGTGPVRLYIDSPTTLGSTDVVQSFTFPKTAGGDAIYGGGGPCHVFFPYNVGRIVISGRGLGEILGGTARGVTCVALPAASPVPPTDPGLRNRGSPLQW